MGFDTNKKIVVKVGSNVLTTTEGLPNISQIEKLAEQLIALRKAGWQVVLVSSGAVAAGKSLGLTLKKQDTVADRQVLAALGQAELMRHYTQIFARHSAFCAQLLVTKQDFKDRHHYLNMRNCLNALLNNRIVPILNENDAVAITELMFTDNDELAGLVAAMLQAEKLIILSNVEGVFDRNPTETDAELIREVAQPKSFDFEKIAGTQGSSFGRGGMCTKCHNALKTAQIGIPVIIANGFRANILTDLVLANQKHGTHFLPAKKPSNIKTWIANAANQSKANIYINQGAVNALRTAKATSLLPIGIQKIEGTFLKGDLVAICTEKGEEIGIGIAHYESKDAEQTLGKPRQTPLIHYDYLLLHSPN